MNISKLNYLFLALLISMIGALVLFAPSSPRPVNAQDAPTATPPRNVFVNAEGTNDCGAESSEHIRFGRDSSHYFQFLGKSGTAYKVSTKIFSTDSNSVSIDTKLFTYRDNPINHANQQPLAQNDDKVPVSTDNAYESELQMLATESRQYWIEVQNLVNEGRGSYCLEVKAIEATALIRPDQCEFNNTVATACEIEIVTQLTAHLPKPQATSVGFAGTQEVLSTSGTFQYNFVPTGSEDVDLDFYKLWIKENQQYECQTYDLSSGTDTNMIFFDQNGGDFEPNLGNDDFESGNNASKLSLVAPYTGWLHILVNPHDNIDRNYADRYRYRFYCINKGVPTSSAPLTNQNGEEGAELVAIRDPNATAPTPTTDIKHNTAAPVPAADQNTIPGAQAAAPLIAPAASTPEAVAVALAAKRPVNVSFVALSPSVPTPVLQPTTQSVEFTLQLYYDQNNNQLKEAGEGVDGMPIHIYTGLIETPLKTSTNSGGAIFFKGATSNGRVLVIIPYLGIRREIAVDGASDIRLRIAPQR